MASPEKKQDYPFVDIFDEDEAEKSFLLSKPTCLIILGKPGIGKKTLARKIAQLWKCTLIEGKYQLFLYELLFGGQSIPEELITKMILKKIESPEVAHFGYVLSGFPSLSEEYMTISEQIEKIRNLKLKPNFLINLKCPDYDLCQRLSGQRQHPDAGQIYQRNQWDPEIIDKRKKKKNQHKGEDEEEEEEEEQEEEDEAAADAIMLSDILPHLVQRPEDFLENAEARINLYKDTMLYPLEDMMAEQDSQYLIELDGNKHPNELFADELFRTLSSFKIIAPRYRWCRSRWGRACPVALKEGNIVMGLPDLAVSFLGKIYLFSSQEALREFMLNPRPYLLPPMPLPPCKVVVFGPPLSGKTTLCNWIANKYKGKVLDMDKLIQPCMEEARKKIIEQARIDAIDVAITKLFGLSCLLLDRFPGAPEKGGWVLDNYPTTSEHWLVLSEKGLLPDTVVCLKNIEKNGIFLLRRLYLTNKDEINYKILERLTDEALKKQKEEEETRRELQEVLKLKEESQQPDNFLNAKSLKMHFLLKIILICSEIMLPEFPEDGFPDVPEIEPFKEKIKLFMHDWQILEPGINDSSLIQTAVLEIAGQTPETLLNQIVLVMEKPFKYYGWEISAEDLDEEADDLQAEGEADEELEEEEQEENDEDEDKINEKKRHMGDTKHFCPVSLKENFILFPGIAEHGAIYREKFYYFSSPESREKFLENPEEYVAHKEPLQAPPLRVCLLGTHGAGKTICGRWLADKLGIFHIQFEERLQEMIMPKTEKRVGPEFDEEPEEDQIDMEALFQELGDSSQTNTETETESESEVVLTDEEEIIKANIVDNEALTPEVLDKIVPEWWTKEPIRSTGFILDGFPRTFEEAQYLSERGLCPDVAVFIQVEESDISDRLLPPRLKKWRDRQNKKMENKKKLKDMKEKIKVENLVQRSLIVNGSYYSHHPSLQHLIMFMIFVIHYSFIIQEELERLLIPQITINGGRKPHIVHYQLYSKLKHLVENRESIFEKCYPISLPLARKMLVLSYKHPSSFGQWDPIKLSEGDVIKPFQNQQTPSLPVIHRQYIYFFSSKENKEKFMKNPIKFIRQPKPKPSVPVKIAIVGPPKSGKTTVAKKFASVYGLMRLSVGDAIRLVLNNQPESELALMLKWHLHKGLTAPDELAIQALEVALMDHVCSTAGVVIDGYPVTRKQVSILEAMRIIPVKIFELQVDAKELFRRALIDKESTDSPPYPIHDSSQILAIQNSCYKKQIDAIRTYYEKEHQNWCVVDAFRSKWWVWNKIFEEVQVIIKQIQTYLERIREGKAASIADLCITPQELQSRLGEFGQYCPVSLAKKGELVDCSVTSSLQSAAEFRGHYYKMASQAELNEFLNAPELYVPPLAPHPLPSPDMLPKKLTMAEVKALFPKKAEMQGYCPVTYLDGKQRYEALVPGTIEYAVEYRDKLYIFENEEKLQKFMRLPEKYWNQKLPHKLPPIKEPVLLTALPLTGYLEQGIATALIKAMNEVGCLKPKFPFLSVKKTALLFVAYHLKAYNPRSSEYVRKKYKRKLEQFIDHCDLIPYLGTKMTRKYKEPQNRPIDFDHKLRMFLCLKDVDPTSG
uniref:Adenylate kinase 9 n=2 Tax=Chrysemys picta bellii TaxID=8478 RepID=A0A8C3FGM5_CHRPI